MNEGRLLEALNQQIKSNENLYYIIWGLHDKSKALRSDIINQDRHASNLKSEIKQLEERLIGKEDDALYWRKEHDKLAQECNKLNEEIRGLGKRLEQEIDRNAKLSKWAGDGYMKASERNAEKNILLKIINDVSKTCQGTTTDKILLRYKTELKQRRKKAKKGGEKNMGEEFIIIFDGSIQYSIPKSDKGTIKSLLDGLCRGAHRIEPPKPQSEEQTQPADATLGEKSADACADEHIDSVAGDLPERR